MKSDPATSSLFRSCAFKRVVPGGLAFGLFAAAISAEAQPASVTYTFSTLTGEPQIGATDGNSASGRFFEPSAVAPGKFKGGGRPLGAQPRFPVDPNREFAAGFASVAGVSPGRAAAGPNPLTVRTVSREESRQFFRAIYASSDNVPMAWTGNHATGQAGDTAAEFKEAVRLRVNFFRAMAGVPADIQWNGDYNAKAQAAAFLMSANGQLSHTPAETWKFYSAAGAQGASNSNLALVSGPDAVNSYISEPGANNSAVGHRRWLLNSRTRQMGTGDVPAVEAKPAANALWVVDPSSANSSAVARDGFIAWPPPGYVPHSVVFPRWSFSLEGADFSAATVSVQRDGVSIAVRQEPMGNYVVPTLVWVHDNLNTAFETPLPRPARDTVYQVTVRDVRRAGAIESLAYTVTVFDPDQAGSDAIATVISGNRTPSVGFSNGYSVPIPDFATGFQWREVRVSPATSTFGAEGGLQGLVAVTTGGGSGLTARRVDSGTGAYFLGHFTSADQSLTLPGSYYIPANGSGSLTFRSWLGLARSTQVARVQYSPDDGRNWSDLYTEAGAYTSAGVGPQQQTGYALRSVSLAPVAGRVVKLRFVFTVSPYGSWFLPNDNSATQPVGWFIDNISVTASVATVGSASSVGAAPVFSFVPTATGAVLLQARPLLAQIYPGDWGAVFEATAVASAPTIAMPVIETHPSSHSLVLGTAAELAVSVRSIAPVTYQWLRNGVALAGATGATLTLPRLEIRDAGTYRVIVTNSGGPVVSNPAELTVTMGPAIVNPARLINLSILTAITADAASFKVGTVLGGSGTSGSKSVVIRAVGPSLVPLGVSGVLADPKIEVLSSGGTSVGANDNWGGGAPLTAAMAQVGAFAFVNAGSRDAAVAPSFPAGDYVVEVGGVGGATGTVIAELYDATPASAFTATTPRLINVSVLKHIGGGLTAGFVIGGIGGKTVLVRVVGPGLAAFGVGGIATDPRMELFDGSSRSIGSNDNWGGTAALSAAFTAVGAFALDATSRDAALVATLQPGSYTVQVSGVGGTTGLALVEVYEVP